MKGKIVDVLSAREAERTAVDANAVLVVALYARVAANVVRPRNIGINFTHNR